MGSDRKRTSFKREKGEKREHDSDKGDSSDTDGGNVFLLIQAEMLIGFINWGLTFKHVDWIFAAFIIIMNLLTEFLPIHLGPQNYHQKC